MSTFSNPEILKKDQRNIEKTIGSVKELLTKQLEDKIELYIKKNNIVKYNESHNKSDANDKRSTSDSP